MGLYGKSDTTQYRACTCVYFDNSPSVFQMSTQAMASPSATWQLSTWQTRRRLFRQVPSHQPLKGFSKTVV